MAPPQQTIDRFWKKYTSKESSRPIMTLPGNSKAKRALLKASFKAGTPQSAVASYEQAAKACIAKVENIIRDCRRLNQKFKDPDFDIEHDHMWHAENGRTPDCLVPLSQESNDLEPKSVKRVEDIFENPHFIAQGIIANDVRQGYNGDCWLMASVCNLSNNKDLLEKLCVAMDEEVGVYGFVFHRDGEWIYEIIDDKLYLTKEDFDDSGLQKFDWLSTKVTNPDEVYRTVMQTGSNALYFASCKDQNATWLPLLEKAYAKAHGDYGAIEGGFIGEGIEDLTGGVTSELFTADILDKDKFWNDELMNVNKSFLFGLSQIAGKYEEKKGIVRQHSYSITKVAELDGVRLVKIKNPWGEKGWEGPWSNGSEEWTPDRMNKLGHTFKNDGSFWISYQDMLSHWQSIDRTRLFDTDWSITQHWTSAHVPWSVQYLDTFFRIKLSKASPVVILLCQLDDRYFQGLEGQYDFRLQFRLQSSGDKKYITQSKPSYFMFRSATTELDLEAGEYDVMVKIMAIWDKSIPKPAEVVMKNCEDRPEKLSAVGKNYDLAHAKVSLQEDEAERKQQFRNERREQRKAECKKAFDAQKVARKKEKLRRLRLDAKKPQPKQEDDGIAIQIKMGATTLQLAKLPAPEKATDATKVVQYDVDGICMKITVEMSENPTNTQEDDLASQPHDSSTNEDSESHMEESEAVEQTDIDSKKVCEAEGEIEASIPGQPRSDHEIGSFANGATSQAIANASAVAAPITEISSSANEMQIPKSHEKGPEITLDDISDDELSWCSDVDAPPDSDSESEDSESEPATNETPKPSSEMIPLRIHPVERNQITHPMEKNHIVGMLSVFLG